MTQREIDKRTGLKGRTRTFMIPVSESKFSGDRVIFQDTGSVRLDYSIDNKNGFPVVDTDLIHLSSGTGNQAQDLEFTNTFGGRTFYVMRGGGEPTSSRDDKALLSVSNANSTYNLKSFRVSGSQSSSLSASQGQVYQPTLETDRRIMSQSVQVKLNGLELSSADNQIGFSSGFDYFVSSSLKEVVIRKRQSDNSGFTIKNTDFVTIIFQSEIT